MRIIRNILAGVAAFCVWVACLLLAYVAAMEGNDHGDVASALAVVIYIPIAAIIGAVPAGLTFYLVESFRAPRP